MADAERGSIRRRAARPVDFVEITPRPATTLAAELVDHAHGASS